MALVKKKFAKCTDYSLEIATPGLRQELSGFRFFVWDNENANYYYLILSRWDLDPELATQVLSVLNDPYPGTGFYVTLGADGRKITGISKLEPNVE